MYNSLNKTEHSSDWTSRDLSSSMMLHGTLMHLSRCHQTFFSRTLKIVLGIGSLDRGRLNARQGYHKPLAGTENCCYTVLRQYECAQCEIPNARHMHIQQKGAEDPMPSC